LKKIARSLPYQTLFVKPLYRVYNKDMSPRHMSRMMYPQMARKEDKGLEQAFTSFTVAIGLGRYFSPSPAVGMSNNPIEDPAEAGDKKIDHSSFYK
jgi:hypothetical protein